VLWLLQIVMEENLDIPVMYRGSIEKDGYLLYDKKNHVFLESLVETVQVDAEQGYGVEVEIDF